MQLIQTFSNIVVSLVVIRLTAVLVQHGVTECLKLVATFLLSLPGANAVLKYFTKREIKGIVSQMVNSKGNKNNVPKKKLISIPEKGISPDEMYADLAKLRKDKNTLYEDGKMFAFVYTSEKNQHFQIQKKAFKMFAEFGHGGAESFKPYDEIMVTYMESFMHDNALNPSMFPTLKNFEVEVVAMTADMLHGDGDVVGTVTSGGTESVMLAVKSYRDRARKLRPNISKPNIVAPITVHPAFEKACHFFCLEMKHVEVDEKSRTCKAEDYVDVMDHNTILLVASSPSYPQALMDPIEDVAKVALKYNLPLHVDACYGGFFLPWLEKIGRPIPRWDFRVDGVTSISADLHKYGFIVKGASVVCYKNDDYRKYQFFSYSGWSGGLFASTTIAGSRPGTHLAAAWSGMRAIGQEGYKKQAKLLADETDKMIAGIREIEGLFVFGNPVMCGFGFGSSDPALNVYAIADAMDEKGWKLEVQRKPDSIHCSILPGHVGKAEAWLKDLEDSVKDIKESKRTKKEGVESMYGMLAVVPNDAVMDDFMVDLFSDIYKL